MEIQEIVVTKKRAPKTSRKKVEKEEIVQEDIIQESVEEPVKEEKVSKKGKKKKIVEEEEVKKEEEVEDDQKKRGRKPKPKVYNIKEANTYEIAEEEKSETLILHLPIKSSEVNNNTYPKGLNYQKGSISTYSVGENNNEETLETSYDEILKQNVVKKSDMNVVFEENIDPKESDPIKMNEEYDKKVKEFQEFKLSNFIKVIPKEEKELEKSKVKSILHFIENDEDDNFQGNGALLSELDKEIQVKEMKPNPFMESMYIEKDIIQEDDMKGNRMNKKNLKNIMVEFINANMYQEWPDQTNIHCWWCCHQFEGPPCTLPEYIRRNKFYVSGCFCNFNCAAAYNFNKNDNNVWERYTLLNLMYKKLFNLPFAKIAMAPPREVLKMFGGYMEIEEFRNHCLKQEKTFQLIKPPLVSIIPKIEEQLHPKTRVVNETILNNTQSKLKEKVMKPLINEKSSIHNFMNISSKKDI